MKISLISLTKSFGDKTLFENLTVDFPEHGTVLVTGGSGVGKTTLLRIIAGLDKRYGGSVIGVTQGSLSYAFQEHRLFPDLTALENVALVFPDEKGSEAIAAASEMLTRLGFTEAEQALYPSELSGGMKQRVSLARAFVKKSELLILDEPFKELDPALVDRVADLIREASVDRLVLTVTHESLEKLTGVTKTIQL